MKNDSNRSLIDIKPRVGARSRLARSPAVRNLVNIIFQKHNLVDLIAEAF